MDLLKDDDKWVGRYAIGSLGNLGPSASAAVPALVTALNDSDPRVSAAALAIVGKIGPEAREAVPSLIERLDDTRYNWEAAHALGEIGPDAQAAIPALRAALRKKVVSTSTSKNATERYRIESYPIIVAFALLKIEGRPERVKPFLMSVVQDKSSPYHHLVIQGLKDLGPEGRPGIPLLCEAREDFDVRLSLFAAETIREIEAKYATSMNGTARGAAEEQPELSKGN